MKNGKILIIDDNEDVLFALNPVSYTHLAAESMTMSKDSYFFSL